MNRILLILFFSITAGWSQDSGSATLPPKIKTEVDALVKSGKAFIQNEEYKKAIADLQKAYKLIPRPKKAWAGGVTILASLGDANYLRQDYNAAIDNLVAAMEYADGMGNPFLHLRLGQSYYEIGDYDNAADEFALAYEIQGEDIFSYEDPKYMKLLKSKKKI